MLVLLNPSFLIGQCKEKVKIKPKTCLLFVRNFKKKTRGLEEKNKNQNKNMLLEAVDLMTINHDPQFSSPYIEALAKGCLRMPLNNANLPLSISGKIYFCMTVSDSLLEYVRVQWTGSA